MTREEILKMPAGKEIDALIADHVMYWNHNHEINECEDGWYNYCMICGYEPRFEEVEPGKCYGYPRYSTNISAAWEVVEALRERQIPIQIRGDEWYDGGGWIVEIMDVLGKKVKHKSYIEVSGPNRGRPNVCLAICHAALLSVLERR